MMPSDSNPGDLPTLSDVVPLQADVRDESAVNNLFAEASKRNGPVSVLIVNHGIWPQNDTLVSPLTNIVLALKVSAGT